MLLGSLALAPIVGCAGGVEGPESTTFNPAPQSGPGSATTNGSMGDTEPEGDEDPPPDPDTGPLDVTGPWDETTSGPWDETTTGPSDTSGDDGPPPPMGNCMDPGTCQAAVSIGSVSGDTGSRNVGESGTDPTWLRFEVTEDDDSLVGAGLSFTATLVSPAGANFDLYVYRSVEGGASGCGGFSMQSTSAGSQDAVTMQWGEGVVPNGLDDTVWVAVEIRAKDDMCAPPQEWTLTVTGNS